jgi:hypothetical protein
VQSMTSIMHLVPDSDPRAYKDVVTKAVHRASTNAEFTGCHNGKKAAYLPCKTEGLVHHPVKIVGRIGAQPLIAVCAVGDPLM